MFSASCEDRAKQKESERRNQNSAVNFHAIEETPLGKNSP
jgi:hypothetical protein